MALTGQLSDLSLAELIEFFCNQRKTGRLKVIYPQAPGYFYIQAGSLVDAKIGDLNGIEAVYYALSLPNASFKFSPVFEATRRTIHQPWTQVVLEGLRRIDEGITQARTFKDGSRDEDLEDEKELDEITESEVEGLEAFKANGTSSAPLQMMVHNAADKGRSKWRLAAAVVVALLASVAVIGVPAGWYSKAKPAVALAPAADASTQAPSVEESASNSSSEAQVQAEESKPADASENGAAAAPASNNDAVLAARREREARDRERMLRAAEERASTAAAKQPDNTSTTAQAASANANAAKKIEAPHAGPKTVTVQVTYDEAGRVTQASGGDATALRIARQKRFPAGKSGNTTVTIPVN
jgi:hypothetical protein